MPNTNAVQNDYEPILTSESKKILVIAGPGSGKTSGILIPKAKRLLEQESINGNQILLLTFSRLAAIDLKKKAQAIGEKSPRATTLHSLCLSFLLSEDDHDIRKRVETIILDFEKDILLTDLKEVLPSYGKKKLKKLLDEFSAGWAVKPHDQVFNEPEEKVRFKSAIVNWLDEHEASMMEEIVYHAVNLGKKLDSEFIKSPKYILVDEYQDLNALEQEFVDLLAKESELLLVVGDPDQSIYSFKYAYPQGIESLKEVAGLESHTLEYTGRCAKKIVEFANKLLIQDMPSRTILLKPLARNEDGQVDIRKLDTQEDEFDFVIESIKSDLAHGENAKEIIVLVPKKKLGVELFKHSKNINAGVDFKISNKIEFSQIEQEKILLFGLLANPDSLLRMRSLIGLNSRSHFSHEISSLKVKYGDLKSIFENAKHGDFNKRNTHTHLLIDKITEIKEIITNNKEKPVNEIVDLTFPESNPDLSEIREIVLKLKEENDDIKSLYLKLIDYTRTVEARDDQVRIMTLMSSKGLDANNVYLIGCNNGNLPGTNRSEYLSDHEFKKEQRRLLYVAATRAKKKLIITWSRYLPFEQARSHSTSSVGVRTINGKKYCTVGICEFLT
jgi:DNA helicase-2/ATP-dependent DNA helicase PcrA